MEEEIQLKPYIILGRSSGGGGLFFGNFRMVKKAYIKLGRSSGGVYFWKISGGVPNF